MNIKINLFSIILFCFLINFTNLKADTPHFIDFTKILNSSSAGAEAQEFLKKKFSATVKKYQQLEVDLRNEEKEIIGQQKNITSEEYQKKVKDLRNKVSKIQKDKQKAFQDIAKLRNSAKEKLLKALNPIIKKYMEDNKIRLVIDKKSVLLGDTKLEITDQITKILNNNLKTLNLK